MAATLSCRPVSILIAERIKRIDAIPAFIILSFSRAAQAPTKLFLASFYSTLKTLISPVVSFESTPIAMFLLKDCGFSLNDANGICRKNPDLLRFKSYDNSRQTLLFLRDKGFHEIGLRKLFSRRPKILRHSFLKTVKPKVEFLEKIGLTGQKLFKALQRYPHILSLSISHTLEPRFCLLQSVLDPDLTAVVSNPESDKIAGKLVSNNSLTASVISEHPRILALSMEKILVGLVKDIEGMGIAKGSKAFSRTLIRFSMLNRDTVKQKLENLRELGFTEEEVRMLIKKLPQLLGLSKEKLWQNFKFLVEEWKLPRNAILSCPAALGYSTEKRLKPRLNAVRALMMKNKSSKIAEYYPPLKFITMSEKDFHRKVVGRFAA